MPRQIRPVARVITPSAVLEGAGVRLRRSIATPPLDYLDPFLLFDDFSSADPADYRRGFPWHPHRGIETVTYILSGAVEHRDSLGNAGRIGAGDLQWMTSGSGIMHEEMPRPTREPLTGFQLWVNLPARLKMTTPRYQDLAADRIPAYDSEGGARIRVIAGESGGLRGPVREIAADPTYLDVAVPPGANLNHPIPRTHAALIYLFEGAARFGATALASAGGTPTEGRHDSDSLLRAPRLVVFGEGECLAARSGEQGARFLLISGQPLGEPIARYGPFVMNTREEIRQALADLERGTFIRAQPESDPDAWYGSRSVQE